MGFFFSVLSKSVQTAHDAVTFVNLSGLINQQITYLSKPAQALHFFKWGPQLEKKKKSLFSSSEDSDTLHI